MNLTEARDTIVKKIIQGLGGADLRGADQSRPADQVVGRRGAIPDNGNGV